MRKRVIQRLNLFYIIDFIHSIVRYQSEEARKKRDM